MIWSAIKVFFGMLASLFPTMPAAAQNPDATPTYGIEVLVSPLAEPHEVRVQAGGPIKAAQELPPPCVGYIASAPDFDVTFEAGASPLYIYVESDSDTTLAVQDPSGAWVCSDDDIGLNPAISIAGPASGHYAIWVGTYRESSAERATLFISETPPPQPEN